MSLGERKIESGEKAQPSLSPCKASGDVCMEKTRRITQMLALLLDSIIKEEACMKYVNASALLPDALVKELQNYIQGGYIYVPADPAHPKRWGEASGYRQELAARNRRILAEYQEGASLEDLAGRYCLSPSAIRKIIYQK